MLTPLHMDPRGQGSYIEVTCQDLSEREPNMARSLRILRDGARHRMCIAMISDAHLARTLLVCSIKLFKYLENALSTESARTPALEGSRCRPG
jgi:hypothetical protein